MDTSFFLKSISDGMANFASEIQREIDSVTKVGEEAKKKIDLTIKEISSKYEKEVKELVAKYASRVDKCEESDVLIKQEIAQLETTLRDYFDKKVLDLSKNLDEKTNSTTISLSSLQQKVTTIIDNNKTCAKIWLTDKK